MFYINTVVSARKDIDEHAFCVNALASSEAAVIEQAADDAAQWTAVGLDGIRSHYTEGDAIGSWRSSLYDQELADILAERLLPNLPVLLQDNRQWNAISINSLFRLIRYTAVYGNAAALIPHYDGPWVDEIARATSLLSMIIAVSRSEDCQGGATRFLNDPLLNSDDNPYVDWTHPATEEDITSMWIPKQNGDALIFPHRILHDSEPLTQGEKTIIRTDVMYRATI